ncbi:MAG: hypothetical protein WD772_13390, partial [Pseudohongiellaceae bacterium]
MNKYPVVYRLTLLTSFLAMATTSFGQTGASGNNWPAYAADTGSTKYSPLDQISADNVGELEIVWRRPALDAFYLTLNP